MLSLGSPMSADVRSLGSPLSAGAIFWVLSLSLGSPLSADAITQMRDIRGSFFFLVNMSHLPVY